MDMETSRRVRALASEAAEAGDMDQVELCERALAGDERAQSLCERALADSWAVQDGGEGVIRIIHGTDWGCDHTQADALEFAERMDSACEAAGIDASYEEEAGSRPMAILGATPEQEEAIRQIHHETWEAFCADPEAWEEQS